VPHHAGDGPADHGPRLWSGQRLRLKLNDIIGAQVVSVPMAVPVRNAERAFYAFMGSLAAVFVLVFIVLNVMLSRMIVQPISRMAMARSRSARAISRTPSSPSGAGTRSRSWAGRSTGCAGASRRHWR